MKQRTQQLTADWVSPKEAAEYLGINKVTVRKLINDGKLKASKIGYRTVRISSASIEKFMESTKQ